MIEITVSNDNFASLLSAKEGEIVTIGHKHTREIVQLQKICNTQKPKKMTLKELEKLLGFPVEIVES